MFEYITGLFLIAISSFISIYIIFDFMNKKKKKRYPSKNVYYMAFGGLWCVFTASNMLSIGPLSMLFTIIAIVGLGVIFYYVHLGIDLCLLFGFILFLFISEFIGQLIMAILFANHFSIRPGNIVQDMITFFGYQIILLLFQRKKGQSNNIGQWYLIIVAPVLSLCNIVAVINLCGETLSRIRLLTATWACILVFSLNIFIFFLFDRISKLSFQKEQLAVSRQQAELQYKYYNELERKYEKSRRLSHDIKNHLVILEEMYKENRSSALSYTRELRNEINDGSLQIYTKSKVLNILLYHNMELAQSYGIKFEFTCEEIDFNFISEFDLSILFSNLFDNAIEECSQNNLHTNFIDLRICQINCFVVILMKNSSEKGLKWDKKRITSQKEGHMGIGLANIKNIVEKYNGKMDLNYREHIFTSQITFMGIDRQLKFKE